jgi:hypothetical protein
VQTSHKRIKVSPGYYVDLKLESGSDQECVRMLLRATGSLRKVRCLGVKVKPGRLI